MINSVRSESHYVADAGGRLIRVGPGWAAKFGEHRQGKDDWADSFSRS